MIEIRETAKETVVSKSTRIAERLTSITQWYESFRHSHLIERTKSFMKM